MGAYLTQPVTEKVSSDEVNSKLECGASSMQGWRINQEDAHNILLDYDENTSFFAVYDGHGGAEVAMYCSQKLPDYIKNTEAYKSGDLAKALEDAFLGFDAAIATKEVMALLKQLADEMNPSQPNHESDNEDSEDGDNVNNLRQEASLPIQDILARYDNKLHSLHRNRLGDGQTPLSPCLRAKKNNDQFSGSGDAPGPSSSGASSSFGDASQSGPSTSSSVEEPSSGSHAGDASLPEASAKPDEDAGVSSTNCSDNEKESNGEVSTSEANIRNNNGSIEKLKEISVPDSSEDNNCDQPEQSHPDKKPECNGDIAKSEIDAENKITSSENGDSNPVKSSAKTPPVSSTEVESQGRPKKCKIRRAAAQMYQKLLMHAAAAEDEDDESDSNDDTFEGGPGNSSDEENVNGVEESSNDGDEEGEDEEEDIEEDSSDLEYDDGSNINEIPGNDSGCTAVVAVLKDNTLYVANAGDSRCIVCREGQAIDMSLDHKPEDPLELDRITKAGGKVSNDGRINGGLNLSRAIGDHSYKQNEGLGPKEQMITALPDVKTLTIGDKDDYMVLACDGIWNFMSSQDVCDFITPRLKEGRERLSQICEEMFDHCLAPSTMGDGTGCDNMTAIIVRFKDGQITDAAKHTVTECAKKRTADADEAESQQDCKRQKIEDLSSSLVTSSV